MAGVEAEKRKDVLLSGGEAARGTLRRRDGEKDYRGSAVTEALRVVIGTGGCRKVLHPAAAGVRMTSLILEMNQFQSPSSVYGTQSPINTFVSCGAFPLRFEAQTNFLPSGENMGKPSKPSL